MIIDYEGMTFSSGELDNWERRLNPNRYIQMWRRPALGELSVIATAAAAKVHLEFTEFPEEAERTGEIKPMGLVEAVKVGITKLKLYSPQKNFFKIRIEENLADIDKARVMSHELGHLVWLDRLGQKLGRNYYHEERFAEHFARRFTEAGNGTMPYNPPPECINGQQTLFPPDIYQKEVYV